MRLPEEAVLVVCQNPRCRREIEEPILLTNLSVTPPEQYDACPHCFTKLELKVTSTNEIMEEAKDSDSQLLKKVEDIILSSNANQQKEEKTSGCPQVFGYLANRPPDVPIPTQCLVCPKMVDCMLSPRESE